MSISLAIGLGVNMGGGPGFTPALLFASGKKGVWYDPSDFGTMFQDSAGTTPVTAVGQPVGKILDKSGNGNHASQGTSANRPTLQVDGTGRYYLAFNGTNSFLTTASVDLSATAQLTMFAGYKKLTTATQILIETSSPLGVAAGAWGHIINDASPLEYFDFTPTAPTSQSFIGKFSSTAGSAVVISHVVDQTGVTNTAKLTTRLNAVTQTLTYSGSDTTPSNFVNQALYIGNRNGGSFFLNGNLYGLCVVGKTASAAEIASTESYLNGKTGAY